MPQKPLYINLIRKPLDRLVSYYYFLRNGDNYRPNLIRRKAGDKMVNWFENQRYWCFRLTCFSSRHWMNALGRSYQTVIRNTCGCKYRSSVAIHRNAGKWNQFSTNSIQTEINWSKLLFHLIVTNRKPGSHWALEQAKFNLVNNYFLVGVTEEMEDFIYLLELSLPR